MVAPFESYAADLVLGLVKPLKANGAEGLLGPPSGVAASGVMHALHAGLTRAIVNAPLVEPKENQINGSNWLPYLRTWATEMVQERDADVVGIEIKEKEKAAEAAGAPPKAPKRLRVYADGDQVSERAARGRTWGTFVTTAPPPQSLNLPSRPPPSAPPHRPFIPLICILGCPF